MEPLLAKHHCFKPDFKTRKQTTLSISTHPPGVALLRHMAACDILFLGALWGGPCSLVQRSPFRTTRLEKPGEKEWGQQPYREKVDLNI